METAPAVVVLVVARHPGQWFEEALRQLAGQDYSNFSVLVVGDEEELAARVSASIPDVHFALVEGSFSEAANRGMEAVEGAAHVLVCHDDVALEDGALRALVEEAYRSNAGLTCPKLVSWEAPERLVSVGMGVDHLGTAHPLVEPGELDQGQHDAVREVFVATGGAVLVRADLWRVLGGLGRGGYLDLSWRAQLAGARVVVAPQAVARHLGSCDDGEGSDRERLRTLWTCYRARTLALVAPAAVGACFAQSIQGLSGPGSRRKAASPLSALAGSFRSPGELLASRRRAQALRRSSDLALWKAQSRGGGRLRAALAKRAGLPSAALAADRAPAAADQVPAAGLPRAWALSVTAVLAALLLVGSWKLLTGPVPLVGELPTAQGGVGSWWHAWWWGPGTGGLGGQPFASPALLFMGLLGVLCAGSAALAAHVLVLAPLVVGPLGVYVGSGRFGSERGRLAASVLYAALPVAYDALAHGHFVGLVSYAVAPWLLAGLERLGEQRGWSGLAGLGLTLALAGAFAPAMLVVVPAMGLALVLGSLLVGGDTGRGDGGGPGTAGRVPVRWRLVAKPLAAAVIATVGAFALLLPWSARSVPAVLGLPAGAHLGIWEILRLRTGPFGGGDLGWAVLVVAALPLLLGRGQRLQRAGRMWTVALGFLALAWAWAPAGGLELLLAPAGAALVYLVALAAAAIEVDLSWYHFGWRQFAPAFGVAAALAAVLPFFSWVGSSRWDLPVAGAEAAYAFPARPVNGRTLPPRSSRYASGQYEEEEYRVLWVGAPGALPLAREGSADGMAYAASLDGLPSAGQLFPALPSRMSRSVGGDLSLARRGETSELGHLLALDGVRYVAVAVSSTDQGLIGALGRQVDLSEVGIDPSYAVYENNAWLPVFFNLPPGKAANDVQTAALAGSSSGAASVAQQFQIAPSGNAAASSGIQYAAVPPGTWELRRAGRAVPVKTGALGTSIWLLGPTRPAGEGPAGQGIAAQLVPAGTTGQHLAALATLVLWLAALLATLSLRPRPSASERRLETVEQRAEPVLVGSGGP